MCWKFFIVVEKTNGGLPQGTKLGPLLFAVLINENQSFVDGNPVETVSSFKLLGVWISKDLSSNTHIDMVLKRANSRL